MRQTIGGFSGRIRVLGPGGIPMPLTNIEQRVIDSIGKKEASKRRSKANEVKLPRGKVRAERMIDYTEGTK